MDGEGLKNSFYHDLLSKITEIADISDCWRYLWMTEWVRVQTSHSSSANNKAAEGRRGCWRHLRPSRHFRTQEKEHRFAVVLFILAIILFIRLMAKGNSNYVVTTRICCRNYVKDVGGWWVQLNENLFRLSYRDYQFFHCGQPVSFLSLLLGTALNENDDSH